MTDDDTSDDEIDDELEDLLEDTDVDTDSLSRIDIKDEHIFDDSNFDDDVHVVFADQLIPEDTPRSLDDCGSFFDGETEIVEGRLLFDTSSQRYCAVREVDVSDRVVTVTFLREADDGRHNTPHGVFEPSDETESVNWFVEGGRFIPS